MATLLGIVIGIFIMTQMNSCYRDSDVEPFKIVEVITHHSDTIVEYSVTIDSIPGPTRIVYMKPDTVYIDTNSYRNYSFKVENEDLSGEFTAVVDGTIIENFFKYNVICPEKTIENTVTIINTDSIIIEKHIPLKRNILFLGGSLGFDSTVKKLGLSATILLKNDIQIFYQRNMRFNSNNEHEVGIKLPIKKRF